ncbi:MAG TPA: hypothetical protein VF355_05000 [Anaerolineaceae bacterium]|jgi:hypothetical protein
MTDDFLHKEGNKLAKVLPIYLGAQVTILLMTFLDFPVYMETYQANHNMTVSAWMGAWFLLVTFGLTIGIILLISKTWKMVFSERERVKLVAGYLLGAIAGLLTLGVRFMPIMPSQYFYLVGGFGLLSIIAYIVWNKRQSKFDEIFP